MQLLVDKKKKTVTFSYTDFKTMRTLQCNELKTSLYPVYPGSWWYHMNTLSLTTICKVINVRKRRCFEGSCVIGNLVQERIPVLQTTATSAGIIQLCGWQTYDCIAIIELKKQNKNKCGLYFYNKQFNKPQRRHPKQPARLPWVMHH